MLGNSDGSIIIEVDLNDKDYESRLKSMEGKTKSFGTQLKSLLSAVGITKAVSAGFNAMKSSIGSAMDRIDTMVQFTRTMTTMTGSSKIAEQALAKIKDTVTGTAYGLDVAAQSCQKFVTSGMSMDKATGQVKTWADAVAFYGDGTNETYANVTDAIAKMVAQGKVQGDQLDRLTDAGIPAVQLFADATGQSFSDVREALSDGSISSEEFLNVLQDAMEKGTDKFATIDGAAKEAGASWKGTFDNMKAAITRGMVAIIESIDEVLQSNGLPTLKEMIADVGKVMEKGLNYAAEHLPELISLIKKLLPVVISVGSAFAAWKITNTVSRASKSISGFFDLMSNGNSLMNTVFIKLGSGSGAFSKLATSAIGAGGGIKGLGSALVAAAGGPVTLIVAAIAAVVAAFVYFWNTSEEFRQFWIDLWNGIVEWFSGIIESIVNFFTVTIPEAWESFKTYLKELCSSIVEWFQNAWNSVIAFFTETIPAWIQSVIDWFNQIPYNIGYMVGQIIGHFIQWGIDLKNFVTEDIPAFINSVVEWFKSLPGKIWEWLKSAWEKVKTWGSNIYTSARDWVSKTIDSVVDWFRSLPGKIWTWLTNAVSKVRDWGSNLWNTGINAAKQLVDSVVQKAKELPGKMVDIGISLIKGLWEGIGSVKDWILDKISGFCDGIVDGMLDFFGIHSPSRLLRDLVGKMLPPGIAVGFEMAMPKSTKDILNEVDGMNAELQKQVNASVNDIGVPLETNARITQQQSVVNAFPKTMQLIRNGADRISLVLENGAEIAHWLAPEMGVELAELR